MHVTKKQCAASLVLLLAGLASANAQTGKDPDAADKSAAPSFRDERRWGTPKSGDGAAQPAATATPQGAHAKPGAAPSTDPAARKSGTQTCGTPVIRPTALEAGRMWVVISSGCRAGQDVVWTYGGAEFQAALDASGRLELVVDCFVGTTSAVELRFADDSTIAVPVEALDLDRVSKIALLWRAPVNLDLHAFEFAAMPGQPGHVWTGAPGTFAQAREQAEKGSRGQGYLSSRSSGDAARDRLEVYTFLHKDSQAFGLVSTAVDFETRGAQPSGAACGAGAQAEIAFRLVALSRKGQVTREAGVVAAAECDRPLDAAARFNQAGLPAIRIRTP